METAPAGGHDAAADWECAVCALGAGADGGGCPVGAGGCGKWAGAVCADRGCGAFVVVARIW